MDILFLLVPLSVVLVFVIGAVFWLALKGGQFDDLESPGLNVVLDDDKPQQALPEPGTGSDNGDGGHHPR
ncbi:MAG TPA: cbb3-type cytochrome oxidase assembly protein CcoS [Burkholderiales bacterium]